MNDILNLIASYDFIQRAFIAGLIISVCASLLGVTIVLKRLSMIGDGLSHISFGAIAVASALGIAPLKLAVPMAAVAAVILFTMSGKKIKGDSGIALISSAALAIGIIVISYRGSSADMNNYLVGSLYSVTKSDLVIALVLGILVVISFVFLYNKIFAVTFDEDFSRVSGAKSSVYGALLAILTSIVVVVGMRLMGALLISSLIVFPALSAMRIFKSFFKVTVCSLVFSLISFLIGFVLTLVLDSVPTGACITAVNFVIFVLSSVVSYCKR